MESNQTNAAPETASAPTAPTKKSKKGLLIGLIAGGVVLIGIIITVVLLIVMGGVSKQDYRNAQETAKGVAQLVSDSSSIMDDLDPSASQDDIDEMVSRMREFQAELDAGVIRIGDEKAVKKDSEAAKKFDALKTVHDQYNRDIDLIIEIYEQALPVFLDMTNIGTKFNSIADESQINNLIDELRDLASNAAATNTSNTAVNESMTAMSDAMTAMADALGKALGGDSTAVDDITSASVDLQTAAQEFSAEMTKLSASDQDLADAINDLGQYLTDQANK